MTFPFLGKFQQTETLKTLSQDSVQALRQARHRSLAGQRNRGWGVKFQSGSFVIYAGNSYATRVPAYDEAKSIQGAFQFSGLTEVAFAKFSGKPSGTGTLTITHAVGGSRSIQVNRTGGIFLQ